MNISILKDEDGIVGVFGARTLSPASLELAVETAYEYARDTTEATIWKRSFQQWKRTWKARTWCGFIQAERNLGSTL